MNGTPLTRGPRDGSGGAVAWGPDRRADTPPAARPDEGPELTILMPCLNEAETLGTCIAHARRYLEGSGVAGEVLVADNGSTDGSQDIARAQGARVVQVERQGLGAALLGGLAAARGRYVVMGDADASYDFGNLDGFLQKLREGFHLVMGNRFKGGIEPGAMPWKNRYLGNPVLTSVGRLLYTSDVGDFHCGLRGVSRDAVLGLGLRTTGMEFASEMVVGATLHGLRIAEVPTTLRPDGRSRPPHLRPWRDGWRHLRFLLTYSPKWLLGIPGLLLLALGLTGTVGLAALGRFEVWGVVLEAHTLIIAAMATVLGVQALTFGLLAKQFGIREGLLPPDPRLDRILRVFTVENAAAAGLTSAALGLGGLLAAASAWSDRGFGDLDYRETMRIVVPAVTLIAVGAQVVLAGFVSGLLRVEPPALGTFGSGGRGGSPRRSRRERRR